MENAVISEKDEEKTIPIQNHTNNNKGKILFVIPGFGVYTHFQWHCPQDIRLCLSNGEWIVSVFGLV